MGMISSAHIKHSVCMFKLNSTCEYCWNVYSTRTGQFDSLLHTICPFFQCQWSKRYWLDWKCLWVSIFNQTYQGTKIQSDNYQKINEYPKPDPKTECQEIQTMISEMMDLCCHYPDTHHKNFHWNQWQSPFFLDFAMWNTNVVTKWVEVGDELLRNLTHRST